MSSIRTEIIAAAILAAVILGAGGCASSPKARDAFSQTDANGDGYVSWEEYHARFPEDQRNVFIETDETRDDRLDISEWEGGIGYRF